MWSPSSMQCYPDTHAQIVINYDLANLGVDVQVKLNVPILGSVEIGKISGNLKQGLSLKVGYSGIAGGEVGVKLNSSDVILYWDLSAFSYSYKDEIKLFSISAGRLVSIN